MKTIDLENLKPIDLRTVLRRDRLILSHHGVDKFAIISIHDLNLLEAQQLESIQTEEDNFDVHEIENDSEFV